MNPTQSPTWFGAYLLNEKKKLNIDVHKEETTKVIQDEFWFITFKY